MASAALTIAGFAIDGEHAVVWNDTAIFRGRRITDHWPKMTVNPLVPLLVTGRGRVNLAAPAELALFRAASYDEGVAAATKTLRATLHRTAPGLSPEDFDGNTTVSLVGWSSASQRVMGAVLEQWRFFEPRYYCTMWASPHVPELHDVSRFNSGSVLRCALAQMAVLRETYPDVTGDLVIAELHRNTITTTAVRDFAPLPETSAATAV